MSAAFEQAWLLLKQSMPPFVPRSIEDQLGMGSFRAAYGDPNIPHVTKFGSGEGLANALVQARLAEMYPELMVGEELHPLPVHESELPDWLTTSRKTGEPLLYTSPKWEDYGNPFMGNRGGSEVQSPFTFTQEKGVPIESTDMWKDYEPHMDLRNELWEKYPLLHGLGMWDVKPENWAQMQGGIELPEDMEIPGQVKVIDPQFDKPRVRPMYTPKFMSASKEFMSDLPELREFAEPWYSGLSQYEDPALMEVGLNQLLSQEQDVLNRTLYPLTP